MELFLVVSMQQYYLQFEPPTLSSFGKDVFISIPWIIYQGSPLRGSADQVSVFGSLMCISCVFNKLDGLVSAFVCSLTGVIVKMPLLSRRLSGWNIGRTFPQVAGDGLTGGGWQVMGDG